MPSLNDLQKFKFSFNDIGGQKADLLARNLPFDDLELPAVEPEPVAQPAQEKSATNGTTPVPTRNGDKGPSPMVPKEAEAPAIKAGDEPSFADQDDGLNFSTFLGTQLDDLPPPSSIEGSAAQTPTERDADAKDAAEFYTPPELLFNLSEELDSTPPDFPEDEIIFEDDEEPAEELLTEGDDLDFEETGDFSDFQGESALAGEPGGTETGDFGLGGLDDFGLPGEPLAADGSFGAENDGLNLGDFGDLNLPDEPFAADGSSETEGGGLDIFEDFDFPGEPLAADGSSETEGSGLDIFEDFDFPGGPFADDGSSNMEDGGLDLDLNDLDNFGLPGEPFAADEPFGTESGGLDLGDLDGFDLPGEPFSADEPFGTESGGLDLGDLDGFDLPGEAFSADEPFGTEASGLDLGDLVDFDLPEGQFAADGSSDLESGGLDLGDLDGFDFSGEPFAADGSFGTESEGLDLGDLEDFGLPEEPFAAGGPSSMESEGLDLGGLGLPDESLETDGLFDTGSGDLDDFGLPGEPFDTETGGIDFDSLDGFDLPGEPMFAADEPSSMESEGLDLEGLDGFTLAEEPPEAESGGLDDTLFADGVSDTESGDRNLGDIDGFGFPAETFSADEPPGTEGDDLDFGGMDGFGLQEEPFVADEPLGTESSDLDFSDGPAFTDEPSETENGGFVGEFDLSSDAAFADGAPQTENGESDDPMDDFYFPDLDQVIEKSKTSMAATSATDSASPEKKTGFWGRPKPEDAPPPSSLEEIKLTDDEFKDLQDTLSDYPINLRIACQEIIAEQDISPEKMSKLIRFLVQGAPAKETAALAGEILDKTITIPKGFEKSSGEALEAEKSTFAYIFVNSFLPVLRLVTIVTLLTASVFYLAFTFVYIPLRAESIYRSGYERIFAGDYQRAVERFNEAFNIHRNRNWFYRYAEAFRDQRQFALAEQMYEMLLRYFPRDRRGVLDFAALQTNYLRNYERADNLLRRQILDFSPNDFDALLAAGDNSLAWAEIDPSRFEDARISFARLLEIHGWTPPIVERMLRYFIRTDNLREILHLRDWFDSHPRRSMQATTLAELGGYLLDKQFEEVRGVPNEFVGQIRGVTDILLEAVRLDPHLPEPHYHLSRFYHSLGRNIEERITLEHAIYAFDNAREESVRRLRYRIDAHQRYADVLINDREFVAAEAQLIRGINLYEDGIRRRILTPSPRYGRLFAGLGDLEYFVKVGDMGAALNFYRMAERHGWAPPEMLFRMGAAYYQLENWGNALEYFFVASSELPLNRRVLFALGNAALKRGDFRAAQGYYERLLSILENQRSRLPVLLPNDRPEYLELAERLMMARNNAGVASEMLAAQTGDLSHRTRAMVLYSEAQRAWDARTRDPATMIRSGSVPLPHLNMRNVLYPQPGFEPQIFIRIDRDALETSPWERLAPQVTW